MHDDTAHAAIERLEDEIERLAQKARRCGKFSLFAKIAIAGGALRLVVGLFGPESFHPAQFFAAIAAVIGGIVLLGSNATTWDETDAALKAAEAARARLIEGIEMRVVDEGAARVH